MKSRSRGYIKRTPYAWTTWLKSYILLAFESQFLSFTKTMAKPKCWLLTAVLILFSSMRALALPVLSISDGALNIDGQIYSFHLTSTEIVSSDLFVPIITSDPSTWVIVGGGVTILSGMNHAEIIVISLVGIEYWEAAPTLTIGEVSGADIGDGTGTASLPGYKPDVTIYDGMLTVDVSDLHWVFIVESSQPVSGDVFIPILVNDPSIYFAGLGVTLVNGTTSSEFCVDSPGMLGSVWLGPEATLAPSPDYNIIQGVAVGEPVPEPVPELSCSGFDSPMNAGAVKVKKNRVLPLKAQLFDSDSYPITDNDIVAPPVINIVFYSGTTTATDVTDYALSAGQGTDGNQFEFGIDKWQFNLKTNNYTAAGTYVIKMESGDLNEYTISPTCSAEFVID